MDARCWVDGCIPHVVNPRARARLCIIRRDFGSVRESREVEFEREVNVKHAGKNCLKVSLFLYLVQAPYVRFASYSIGNKWYTRVRARVSCFVEMKSCSLLPTGWSAALIGATLTVTPVVLQGAGEGVRARWTTGTVEWVLNPMPSFRLVCQVNTLVCWVVQIPRRILRS